MSSAETFTSFPPPCSAPTAFGAIKAAVARTANTAKQPRIGRRVITASTILPRAECGFTEQRLLRGGLRAPILRRGIHLAAELSRGMPAPARIVEHAAGECDHIGLAGRDDVFGLARLRDQADRHGGHPRRLLDRLRKGKLIARRQRNFLLRRYPAGGNVDPV